MVYTYSDLQVKGQRKVSFVMSSEVALNPMANIDLSFADKHSEDSNGNKSSIFINSVLITPLNMIDDQ